MRLFAEIITRVEDIFCLFTNIFYIISLFLIFYGIILHSYIYIYIHTHMRAHAHSAIKYNLLFISFVQIFYMIWHCGFMFST